MKNIIFSLLAISVLVLSGCTAVDNQVSDSSQTEGNQEQQTSQEHNTNNDDETSDWKVYKNTQLGFEVKYPNNWKALENDNRINFMPIDGQDVALSFFVYNKSIEEAQNLLPIFSVPGRNIDSRTNITINSIEWLKLVVMENQIAQLTHQNSKTYAAQYSTFENISPKIISTFKLTE